MLVHPASSKIDIFLPSSCISNLAQLDICASYLIGTYFSHRRPSSQLRSCHFDVNDDKLKPNLTTNEFKRVLAGPTTLTLHRPKSFHQYYWVFPPDWSKRQPRMRPKIVIDRWVHWSRCRALIARRQAVNVEWGIPTTNALIVQNLSVSSILAANGQKTQKKLDKRLALMKHQRFACVNQTAVNRSVGVVEWLFVPPLLPPLA